VSNAANESNQIAIIGLAGRFPGARDLDEYWRNLRDGVESIQFFTRDEMIAAGVGAARLEQPGYVNAGGTLDGIEMFDASFFAINPREAEITDPQHRLFLECAWQAVEHAGYDPHRYAGTIGVYAGAGANTYWMGLLERRDLIASIGFAQLGISNDKDHLAMLASYKLNLSGPSITVQTGCSTSLVAVHLACQSLLNGECDMALAGASRVDVLQRYGYEYKEGGIASPDGHCRAFDAAASGCAGGSGVGVVILKRMADAVADRDTIHAVIRGSAVNNDGAAKVGYTAPSVNGQARVISEALAVAQVGADEISFIEAHGTGTHVGDPIEVKALTQVFRATTNRMGFCALGSVKTNIGHLDTAAGMAGLLKTVLALKHGVIPATLNFNRANPLLELESSPFYVNTSAVPWVDKQEPRRAGVNSFGMGGTNAHIVLEEAPPIEPSGSARQIHLLIVSARNPDGLDQATGRLSAHLSQNPTVGLADVAYTLQLGRRAFPHRRCLVSASVAEAVRSLDVIDPQCVLTGHADGSSSRVAFMFGGQGTERVYMGRSLYAAEPCFRRWIDTSAELLKAPLGLDLRGLLYPEGGQQAAASDALRQTRFAQPALFATEYALSRWLINCGIQPDSMIGHSLGEYVAACLAGVFTLEEGLRLVAERGRLMQQLRAGAMVAVQLPEDEVAGRLGTGLWLGAINGGRQCAVSGTVAAIEALEISLRRDGITCRRLGTGHAFHSGLMDPMLESFARVLEEVRFQQPSMSYISNLTGTWISAEQACDPRYWVRHLREPVRFGGGIGLLAQDPGLVLLEVGAGDALCGLARLQARGSVVLPTMAAARTDPEGLADAEQLYRTLGRLWLRGLKVDWDALYEHEERHRVSLPTYPFERARYWIQPGRRSDRSPGNVDEVTEPISIKKQDVADRFYVPLWKQTPQAGMSLGAKNWNTAIEGIRWLVFVAAESLSTSLTERLKEFGDDVIIVEPGDGFAACGPGRYRVRPAQSSDYFELGTALTARGPLPNRIVHLWSLQAEAEGLRGDSALERVLETGFSSLVYLARMLGEVEHREVGAGAGEGESDKLRIAVLTDQMQDVTGEEHLQPEQALALGPCMVVPQEYGSCICRSIDVSKPPPGSHFEAKLIEHLVRELRGPYTDTVVAYRGGQRWVQTYELVKVQPGEGARARLMPGGVWLITGGLGRIGLKLAEYLCREARARVVLVSRRRLPPRNQWSRLLQDDACPVATRNPIERLLALEREGSEVWAESADVADLTAMSELIRRVKARWGRLQGVIHGAGLVGPERLRLISETDDAASLDQFRAKVWGTRVLGQVLEGEELDFCFLQSSLASVLGGLGLSAYAAANRFMDAFARARNRSGVQRWTTINWEGWAFSGSESDADPLGIDRLALDPVDGATAFKTVLGLDDVYQVVISSADLGARIRQWSDPRAAVHPRRRQDAGRLQGNGPADAATRHPRPELSTSYEEPEDDIERGIVGILEEMLGIEPISVLDNFFELGGHSLLAIQLVSLFPARIGPEVTLRTFFEHPTARTLANCVREQTQADAPADLERIVRLQRPLEVPLSFQQHRLWFIHQLEPDSAAYNIPLCVRLKGMLSVPRLRQCLREIVRRHEILRTRFRDRDGQPVQLVSEAAEIAMPACDLGEIAPGGRRQWSHQIAVDEVLLRFDLAWDSPIRARLLPLADVEHLLILTMHHIVSDGWSVDIMVRELAGLYQAYGAGAPAPMAEPEIQYADYALWQRQRLVGERLQRQLDYWKPKLTGAAVIELPADRPRPVVRTRRGATENVMFSEEITLQLDEWARREGATLFIVLLAGLQAVLARYCGEEDICVGSPIAGRTRPETEAMIGLFVNTLVMRTDLAGNPTARELLGRVRETALEAYAHEDFPFEMLVEELQPDRSLGSEPLFEVMLILHNRPTELEQIAAGLEIRHEPLQVDAAKFNLTLALVKEDGRLRGSVEYATDLFDPETIQRFFGHLAQLLAAMATWPRQRVMDIMLLTPAEREQILVNWNRTDQEYGDEVSVERLFEQQAERSPEAVAVVFEDQCLSYMSLDRAANQLAYYLRRQGAVLESRIALGIERGPEMAVGLLGVLKSGAAYVPMNLRYPAERLAYMLQDCKPHVLLAAEGLMDKLGDYDGMTVSLDSDWDHIALENTARPEVETQPQNLAYVIYTSGSTGKPKPVGIERRALANLIQAMAARPGLKRDAVFFAVTSLSFDIAALEIFLPLVTGARVVVASEDISADGYRLVEALRGSCATHMQATPSLWRLAVESGWTGGEGFNVFCGGEALSGDLLDQLIARSPTVWNLYGPTETTIWSSDWLVGSGFPTAPIGTPTANTRMYILDKSCQPNPVGVPGELHIAGAGLARGYPGRPDLTAGKFVPDPFSAEPGRRLYRTGDIAKYRRNADIQFLNRLDRQVKVRGFRIELGDIESVLGRHPGLRQCALSVFEDESGGKRLVAYVVASGNKEPSTLELREYLQERLPDYMVPAVFIGLPELPITSNGKLDRKAFPSPPSPQITERIADQQTPIEQVIAAIWSDVLGRKTVGADQNFFELGGHSLLATRVISRIGEALGVEMPLRRIFEVPTVRGLAQALGERTDGMAPIKPADRREPLPLSYAQQRLWFLDQLEPESGLYNLSLPIRISGALNLAALEQTIGEIVRRHESLRTSFPSVNGEPVQSIQRDFKFALPNVDLSGIPPSLRDAEARRWAESEARRPFSLAEGPVLRCALLNLGDDERAILLTFHHIVFDGWSSGVLTGEVDSLYSVFSTGAPSSLRELRVQYADFALWQREWLRDEVLDEHIGYWKQQLCDPLAILELPQDRPRPPALTHQGARQTFHLSDQLIERLRAVGLREAVTPFMVLLAGFQSLLYRYTGAPDLVVGTDVANRNRFGTEELIGFFVNQLALRGDFSTAHSFRQMLRRVRETTIDAYSHADAPFERVVQAIHPSRDLSRTPLFQVKMILQNVGHGRVELPGLELTPIEVESGFARFDITMGLIEQIAGFGGFVEYSTELFDGVWISRMIDHFVTLLEAAVADPRRLVRDLPILTSAEQENLRRWNDTGNSFSREQCLHELFEAQAARQPDSVSVVFNDIHLSYAELDSRASLLGNYLGSLGIALEDCVGLYIDRSPEVLVAILGILKAGAAYVPLDLAYKVERLAHMIADSELVLVITREALVDSLPAGSLQAVCLDSEWDRICESDSGQVNVVGGANAAYIIYTSGSTSQPKGTVITHGGICNLAEACTRMFRLGPASRVLQFSSLSFDASVFEISMAIHSGACLCLLGEDARRSGEELTDLLIAQAVTNATLPPTVLREIGNQHLSALETIVSAGEACTQEILMRWAAGRQFYNAYGPTETTVCATAFECQDPSEAPAIGYPLANTSVHLLGPDLNPVPIQIAGELYIGGVGLARGYLNRPDLTAERFVPNLFGVEPGARLYKSGDLATRALDGRVCFIGRTDHQIKVRGFRIEPQEVEACLLTHWAVRRAVVVARGDGDGSRRLVAYLVCDGLPPTTGDLQGHVKSKLPDYMVPANFVFLDEMPLMPSGKVDRRALPDPGKTGVRRGTGFTAPRSAVERTLAGIWSEVLGIERVGIHDNFFELGGDSILSIRVVARTNIAGIHLSPQQVFKCQTIAELAEAVRHSSEGIAEQGFLTGPVPLSPIQHWFFEQNMPDPDHYNQAVLLETPAGLNLTALMDTVRHFVFHHDALRLRFEKNGAGWVQTVSGDLAVLCLTMDLSGLPQPAMTAGLERLSAVVQRSLSISNGPLITAAFFSFGDSVPGRLLLVVHHLAVDGVSFRILLEDLELGYQRAAQGQPIALGPKTTSYRQWSQRLVEYSQSGELESELQHWLSLKAAPSPLLPRDRSDGPDDVQSARTVSVSLDPVLTEVLLHEAPGALQVRINDVLLTALARAFWLWTGNRDLLVDMEGHGRQAPWEGFDLSRTVGWFTTLYPLLVDLGGDYDILAELNAVSRQLALVPGDGQSFGILRYLVPRLFELLRPVPQPGVSFNYFGQLDQVLAPDSLFSLAWEASGPTRGPQAKRTHAIEINALVIGGALTAHFTYSRNAYYQATMERLAHLWLESVRGIVERASVPIEGFGQSDRSLVQLDEGEFERLAGKVEYEI
jgi:amino acid adenylation domain-containing protein/non-ribosomal peptide synthase protein (TIGR01720 family)